MPNSAPQMNGHDQSGFQPGAGELGEQTRARVEAIEQMRRLAEAPSGFESPPFSPSNVVVTLAPRRRAAAPRVGLIDAFVNTCQRWHLTQDQQLTLLGLANDTSFGAQILEGRIALGMQDMEDRIGYVVGISLGLGAMFGESVAAERDWLNRPRPELRGKSPFSLMLEGHMANLISVAELVHRERGL